MNHPCVTTIGAMKNSLTLSKKKIIISFLILGLLSNATSAFASFEGSKCNKRNATKVVKKIHYYCNFRNSDFMMWQRDYNSSPMKNSTNSNTQFSMIILPSFVGYSQAEVNTWKRQNSLKINIHYSTAIGYDYSVNCQVHGEGTVLKQRQMAGTRVQDSPRTTIWLDIDC